MGTGSFPGIKSGRGVTLIPQPFYYRGQERVELYLYSPYGPYGLYRASVHVQGCTLPLSLQYLSRKFTFKVSQVTGVPRPIETVQRHSEIVDIQRFTFALR